MLGSAPQDQPRFNLDPIYAFNAICLLTATIKRYAASLQEAPSWASHHHYVIEIIPPETAPAPPPPTAAPLLEITSPVNVVITYTGGDNNPQITLAYNGQVLPFNASIEDSDEGDYGRVFQTIRITAMYEGEYYLIPDITTTQGTNVNMHFPLSALELVNDGYSSYGDTVEVYDHEEDDGDDGYLGTGLSPPVQLDGNSGPELSLGYVEGDFDWPQEGIDLEIMVVQVSATYDSGDLYPSVTITIDGTPTTQHIPYDVESNAEESEDTQQILIIPPFEYQGVPVRIPGAILEAGQDFTYTFCLGNEGDGFGLTDTVIFGLDGNPVVHFDPASLAGDLADLAGDLEHALAGFGSDDE